MALCARLWKLRFFGLSGFISRSSHNYSRNLRGIWKMSICDDITPFGPSSKCDVLFRAVHFVATKKVKPSTDPPTSTPRTAITDITNQPSSESTDRSEEKPIIEGNEEKSISTVTDDEKPKTPFQQFRGRYLIVTDFASQLWCEQQLAYNLDPPPGVVISEKPQMAKGTDFHLARELEVQDIVEIDVTSKEDAFAVKLLNLLSCLQDFLSGQHLVRREIPIFGTPFGLGVFVVGIIDEVRFDSKSRKVDVVELKTRRIARLPSRAQKKTHDIQVMLYRRMWNELVDGSLSKADVLKSMKLRPDAPLGEDISEQLRGLKILENAASITLDSLLDRFFTDIVNMPSAELIFVEYCHQETKEQFAVDTVRYDEGWLRNQLENSSSYWHGERSPRGVDIEEAWKCKFCDFVDVCAWRIKKQEECAERNRQNFARAEFVAPRVSDK